MRILENAPLAHENEVRTVSNILLFLQAKDLVHLRKTNLPRMPLEQEVEVLG